MTTADHDGCSLAELTFAFGSRALSPVTALERCLTRIDECNGRLNAFVEIDRPRAMQAARASAQRWAEGAPLGPVDGVPFTVKNNLLVEGYPVRRGSRITGDGAATENAPAVQRCLESGAVFVGLTTMPEFAIGPVTISPLTGITRNAWVSSMQAGGSSGGAAVAVAAGFCRFALATDAGGSIRIPAAMNGAVGFKPSNGVVPAYPSSAISALACIGPITRRVADAVTVMNVIAQPDVRDRTLPPNVSWQFGKPCGAGLAGVRCALSATLGLDVPVDEEITRLTSQVSDALRSLGASVDLADPPVGDFRVPYLTLVRAGYQFFLRRLTPHQREQLSDPVKEVLESPTVTLEEYLVAQESCAALSQAMADFHKQYDLLITPVVAASAVPADRFAPKSFEHLPDRRAWAPFTSFFNMTQQPAISIPAGLTKDGLPCGVQLVAKKFRDRFLLESAAALESIIGFDTMPPLSNNERQTCTGSL